MIRVASAVFGVASAAFAIALLTGCGAPDPPAVRHYTDPAGWSLTYPRSMYLEHSTNGPGMVTFAEVTVASFAPSTGVHSGGSNGNGWVRTVPPVAVSGRFPSDGVAFRMYSLAGGPAPLPDVPDSMFPIELPTFRPSGLPPSVRFNATDGETVRGSHYRGVPPSLVRSVEADGAGYTAIAWIGQHASAALRAALAQVVASLRFPRLRPGELVDDLEVLDEASRYPVGSFTPVSAPGERCRSAEVCRPARAPFYLVHAPGRLSGSELIEPCGTPGTCVAPGAFYAIGWTWEDRLDGYRSRCDLRLDRADDEFYCTNSRARWDRLGRVIERPRGAPFGDPLQFAFAKVAWDGHVVFAPGFGANPPGGEGARLLWPAS